MNSNGVPRPVPVSLDISPDVDHMTVTAVNGPSTLIVGNAFHITAALTSRAWASLSCVAG